MGVRRKLLRDLLSSLKYIKNLSEEQIRASLWRGEGTLYNIELEQGKLQELLAEVCPVALEIVHVRIDELYIRIPWSQLGTQSVLIVAKSVDVCFNIHCEDEEDWRAYIGPMLRRAFQTSQDTLAAAPGSLADPAGAFNQLTMRLLHSLQIQAGHIHISIVSRHRRHFSAHGVPAASSPGDLLDGPPEEAIVIEFEDLLLSPCDAEKVPSDQMKAMAVYEPSERVLGLTRLLKCRSFRVIPPKNGLTACQFASEEYMDIPGVMNCLILDRCTSDGPRICPVLLRTELLFELTSALRVKACECQVDAFMAMLSDIGQLEEWRFDETIVGERRSKLLDCSEVARTFARGPEWQRQKTASESLATSLASGLSAGTTSIMKLVMPDPAKKKPASGFHPVELPESHEGSPEPRMVSPRAGSSPRSAALSPSVRSTSGAITFTPADASNAGAPQRCASEGTPSTPQSRQVTPTSGDEKPPCLKASPAPGGVTSPAPSSQPSPCIPSLSLRQPVQGAAPGGSGEAEEKGLFTTPASSDPDLVAKAYFEEVDEDSDGEDEDYFSVASRSKCSSPRPRLAEAADKRHRSAMPTNWIDAMSSWFGVQAPSTAEEGEAVAATVDLTTQFNRIEVTFSSLAVHITVPTERGPDTIEAGGERLSICLDTTYELTETQRECVRRFAWPDQEYPIREPRLQLPRRIAGLQLITWHSFVVSMGGEELLRSTDCGKTQRAEPMLAASIRGRSAPPEVLPSQDMGELVQWPSFIRLSHAFLLVQPTALQEILEIYKRLMPFLDGKVPQPTLISPEGEGAVACQETNLSSSSKESKEPALFPAQCLSVEICNCEFQEASEATAIATEQRWPWRGVVPHLVLRSDANSWDLSDILRVSTGGYVREAQPTAGPPAVSRSNSHAAGVPDAAEAPGMVSIPKEMFDELVRRSAESTKKDAQVSAAREELQRAYISMASTKRRSPVQTSGTGASSGSGAGVRAKADSESSDDDQDELNQLRQKCLQLEISLQSQARTQRRLESELAHHQALSQEELRRLLATTRGPRGSS